MKPYAMCLLLLGATSATAAERLDMSDPDQRQFCANLTLLIGQMAMESHGKELRAQDTDTYKKIVEVGPGTELADALARFSDQMRGRMKPELVGPYSTYSLCLGIAEELVTGPVADEIGQVCNSAPAGEELTCMRLFFEDLAPAAASESGTKAQAQSATSEE
ncbi:hypothetical protein [Pseudomarimonas arenosa]|uniref:Uncharacterized protein n=1 Tax=Pseudomarimonas arenosa TaxID=2774145 RepID=A0AAW3ZDK5_9GAMM|nr:hypothetical protein [Pseudomarimonas arenosa]MBD8524266.1 hypothetical protein [Pseudomarimonas arenosa]